MSTNVGSNYTKKYFKMSNTLAQRGKSMTDQEFRLLSYYSSFPTSWTFQMTKMIKDLLWSESKIKRTRLSLQENGFLLIRRLPKNEFIYYIGKKAVKEYLVDKQRKENTDLTDEELSILKKAEKDDDFMGYEELKYETHQSIEKKI